MSISDWSSDVCSSDLDPHHGVQHPRRDAVEKLADDQEGHGTFRGAAAGEAVSDAAGGPAGGIGSGGCLGVAMETAIRAVRCPCTRSFRAAAAWRSNG